MILQGKGMYLWRIKNVEGGDPNAIADLAKRAGLTHVLVKVADGRGTYNTYKVEDGREMFNHQQGVDHVPAVVAALRARGIQAWGWQYIYGESPLLEARMAIRRVKEFELDGFVVNAEDEFRVRGKDVAARQYMSELRRELPNTPLALSSFRYPNVHHPFPFSTFLEYCDLNMPQVYWVRARNPAEQLLSSLRQYQSLTPWRTYFPTGAAYGEHGWRATPSEVTEYLKAVKEYDLPGTNFWEMYFARHQKEGELWNAVQNFAWAAPGASATPEIHIRYLEALNSGDPLEVAALYNDSGVHVNAERSAQGNEAILGWYTQLLHNKLPGARFNLTGTKLDDNIRTITWTAESSAGKVLDGKDSIGVKGEKIGYHYTYFTVQKN